MAKLPTQQEVIDKRSQELSDKAKAEKETGSVYDKYTSRLVDEVPQTSEAVLDKLMGLYVDNVRQNGKKADGFGTKAWDITSKHIMEDYLGISASTERGKEELERIVSSYVPDTRSNDEEFKGEKMNIPTFQRLLGKVEEKLGQTLQEKVQTSLMKIASKDVAGFKSYTLKLAKENKVSYKPNDIETIQGILQVYLESVSELMKAKQKKKSPSVEE